MPAPSPSQVSSAAAGASTVTGAAPDRFDAALNHATAVYGLYVTQRQNVVNYYLAAVGLLTVAYAGAVDRPQWPVAVAVAVLGIAASAGAYLQDQRLKQIMEVSEQALTQLQEMLIEQLGGAPSLDALRIQHHIDRRRPTTRLERRGPIIRGLYATVGALFALGAIYALVTGTG